MANLTNRAHGARYTGCLGALVTGRAPPTISRLIIDTNVVLDVILERKPWVEDATTLLDAIAKGRAEDNVSTRSLG